MDSSSYFLIANAAPTSMTMMMMAGDLEQSSSSSSGGSGVTSNCFAYDPFERDTLIDCFEADALGLVEPETGPFPSTAADCLFAGSSAANLFFPEPNHHCASGHDSGAAYFGRYAALEENIISSADESPTSDCQHHHHSHHNHHDHHHNLHHLHNHHNHHDNQHHSDTITASSFYDHHQLHQHQNNTNTNSTSNSSSNLLLNNHNHNHRPASGLARPTGSKSTSEHVPTNNQLAFCSDINNNINYNDFDCSSYSNTSSCDSEHLATLDLTSSTSSASSLTSSLSGGTKTATTTTTTTSTTSNTNTTSTITATSASRKAPPSGQSKRSVLMNLLIDGLDVNAGYTSHNCRALPQKLINQQHRFRTVE